jgi:hypothetical protein
LSDVVPRLSAGSGDGYNKLCAMQSISWQRGDVKITAFPECSSRYLAILVQYLNDELADDTSGYLSAEDALSVLDLGWLTVGTREASAEVMHKWFAGLLDSPRWGVVRFLKGRDGEHCKAVANAHRLAAGGHEIEWTRSLSAGIPSRSPLQSLALYVVYHLSSRDAWDIAVRMACHTNYYYGTSKSERVYWTGAAIEAWRSLQAQEITEETVSRCWPTTPPSPASAQQSPARRCGLAQERRRLFRPSDKNDG